jgi:hypothetical protein
VAGAALREFEALIAIPGKLNVGPHTKTLIDELVRCARAQHYLSVIVMAAALVDLLNHEGGAEANFDEEAEEEGFGLSMLRADERRALDRLRGMRNRILHYQGPSEGLSGHASDKDYLQAQAEAAIKAILPLLELQEMY